MSFSRRATRLLAAAGMFASVACSQRSAPLSTPAPLAANAAARVAGAARLDAIDLPVDLVARVSSAREVAPRAAVDALVDDALLAQGAASTGLDADPTLAWRLTAARAGYVATRLRDDARAAGHPTDAEVARVTESHWREVALPEQVRVIHAVVLRPKPPNAPDPPAPLSPQVASRARAIAREIANAVGPATSDADFESRANAVAHDGFDVKIERLPPFIADGRVSQQGSSDIMDETFAAAAFTLKAPGATSAVVESPFGWHVIRLLEQLPAQEIPLERRRSLFEEEIFSARARAARESLLAQASSRAPVEVSTAAEELMAAVRLSSSP